VRGRLGDVAGVRKPGGHGLTILRTHARRCIAAIVTTAVLLIVLGLALWFRSRQFLVVEAAAIVMLLVLDRVMSPRLERRQRGVRGEQRVGAILDSLAEDGWRVLHDAPTVHGNIDHVAVGPAGVVTIETKSHRGRIAVAELDRPWLAQAYAECKHLERLIEEPVDGLLVFSDAYLIGRPVLRRRGVLVLPARLLAQHLRSRRHLLSPEEVDSLYERVTSALGPGG
jgi:hypothetical protein